MSNEELKRLGYLNAKSAIEARTNGTKKLWNADELAGIEVEWRDNVIINELETTDSSGWSAYHDGVREAIDLILSRQRRDNQ